MSIKVVSIPGGLTGELEVITARGQLALERIDMPTKRKRTEPRVEPLPGNEFDNSPAVTEWLNALEHPLKPVIELIRPAVLAADPAITEGLKWNTASFYCHGWFATVHSRAKNGIQLILHHGAKVRDGSTLSKTINDPTQLLTWLAKDRATIMFQSTEDFERQQAAFKKIIKQWAKCQRDLASVGADSRAAAE